MAMIEAQGLTKRYRDRVAVENLTFALGEGEILGFLGPNGAGKSTTMRMLTGFLPPTSGSAKIAGFDVFASPLEVKRRIGYLPETPPLYREMTVRGYLRFVARLKGIASKQLRDELDRVARVTAVVEVMDRLIENLSKGFRQRVGLAQALLGSPPLLILDEPTEGLDPTQRKEFRSLVKELAGKHTIILSTHLLHEVQLICKKVLIIHHGAMKAFESLEKLPTLEEFFIKTTSADPSGAGAAEPPQELRSE